MRELDILGEASLGAWLRLRKKHLLPPGSPCANCATELKGAYCYNCGQLAEGFERSIWHLIVEVFESFFHFDGRLFRTVPKLAIKPGELTREYLDGKRAYQIPPLRMFLVVLLLVFFVGGLNLKGEHGTNVNIKEPNGKTETINVGVKPLTPDQQKKIDTAFGDVKDRAEAAKDAAEDAKDAAADKAQAAKEAAANNAVNVNVAPGGTSKGLAELRKHEPTTGLAGWLTQRAKRAMKDPDLFWLKVDNVAHDTAFLALPIAAALLSLLYIFQRKFYVFDHLIFSMHSLSFQGLVMSVVFLLRPLTGWADALFLISPVHLFVHMRGTYGSSVIGTLIRMWLLAWGSLFGFLLLFLAVLWLGLSGMDH